MRLLVDQNLGDQVTTRELGHTSFRLNPSEESLLLRLATSGTKSLVTDDSQVKLVLKRLARMGLAKMLHSNTWQLTPTGLHRSQTIF